MKTWPDPTLRSYKCSIMRYSVMYCSTFVRIEKDTPSSKPCVNMPYTHYTLSHSTSWLQTGIKCWKVIFYAAKPRSEAFATLYNMESSRRTGLKHIPTVPFCGIVSVLAGNCNKIQLRNYTRIKLAQVRIMIPHFVSARKHGQTYE